MDKYPKSNNDIKDQKIRVDKRDQKPFEKNDKNEAKSDKVDRPVKWHKNKHSFVVAGKDHYTCIGFFRKIIF